MYTKYPTCIVRGEVCIPMDIGNADFRAYEEWLAQGNTPDAPAQPPIPELILRAIAETRIQRQPIIGVLDGLQASALAVGDPAKATVIETAKQALRDITTTDLTTCQTYEEMRLKVKARYIQIASAAPALKAAFSEALK